MEFMTRYLKDKDEGIEEFVLRMRYRVGER